MNVRQLVILSVLSVSAMMAGSEAAGSVQAAKGLELNGQTVPVAGMKSWPVAAGDELKSGGAPLVLTMKDGSRLVLGRHTRAKVESGLVRLLSGTMEYELALQSALQVAVNGSVLAARTGVASTIGNPATMTPTVTPMITTEALPAVSRRRP